MRKSTKSVFILIFSAIISAAFFSCTSGKKLVSANPSVSERPEVIETKKGKIRGVYAPSLKRGDPLVELYAGIPFAKPPVGELRWKAPVEAESWDGILEADTFAPRAMQKKSTWLESFIYKNFIYHKSNREDDAPMSEDCLYLNVWKPAEASESSKLPVLVYIHGGSLMSGSSYSDSFDGTTFAKNGIVVVTVAYRLGVFGYFALDELAAESPEGSTGNYGLLDQIAALKWVHENIGSFGGDCDNISIAGESAGASSVGALCTSPLSKGLFKRAIAESSGLAVPAPPHTYRSLDDAKKMGRDIMAEFKVSSVDELRKIPAEKLIKTKFSNSSLTVDGHALTEPPYQSYLNGTNHEEALLNGFNANEAYFFNFFGGSADKKNYRSKIESYFGTHTDEVIAARPGETNAQAKENWNEICSAVWFANSHDSWTKLISAQGKPAYEYYFTKENGGIGTNHSGEIIYCYGNVPESKYYDEADHKLEKIMASYWMNFVRTGNPNGINFWTKDPLPEWPLASENPGKVLELGENVGLVSDPYADLYPIIEKTMKEKSAGQSK
ncbi:MAG: carboxylesterase family protein [Treponema sp.]|nr:carboxylesterase family protein [Treponema sp.]